MPLNGGLFPFSTRAGAQRADRVATIPYDAPLIEAAKLLSRVEVNLVVVCDSSNALAGVITRTDVVRQISDCAGHSCTTAVSAVMTREVTCCRPADLLTRG